MRSRNSEQGIFDGGSRRSLRKYELFTNIRMYEFGNLIIRYKIQTPRYKQISITNNQNHP